MIQTVPVTIAGGLPIYDLDSRIGVLEGAQGVRFYAFANGYHQPETVGTREEVEVALGLREPAPVKTPVKPTKPAPDFKTFSVHIRFQYPTWNTKDGITYDGIVARTKGEAIKKARTQAWADGNDGSGLGVGLAWFTATEEDDR